MKSTAHRGGGACLFFALVVLVSCLSAEPGGQPASIQADAVSSGDLVLNSEAARSDRVRIGPEVWFSTGRGEWEERFPPELLGIDHSVLEWKGLDSVMLGLGAEVFLTSRFSLKGTYAAGAIRGGEGTDTDLMGTSPILQSTSDTRGDTTSYSIDLALRLLGTPGMRTSHVDVFAGYQYYEDSLEDQNGVQTVYLGFPVSEPFDGLDSTYDFEWRAYRLGVRGGLSLLPNLAASAQVATLFGVDYTGEGYWNLRDDYRQESPSFVHEASPGTGLELAACLTFDVMEHLSVEGGYRWTELDVDNGVGTTYFDDGTAIQDELDHATSRREGFFVSVLGQF